MKKKTIVVHNPNNLPTMPYTGFVDFQGDLKDPMSSEEHNKMRSSLLKHGVFVPTFVWFDSENQPNILDGHQRKVVFASLEEDGYEIPEIPYVKVHASSRQDAAEKLLQINSRYATMNPYANWFKDIGFSDIDEVLGAVNIPELSDSFRGEYDEEGNIEESIVHSTLAERFIIPPFSVFDTRQGYWQERKRAWLSLGIQSELGRGVVIRDKRGNNRGFEPLS